MQKPVADSRLADDLSVLVLSRLTKPSWLKEWGEALAKRIGARKAKVAVARKLAVVLHRMWMDQQEFRWRRKAAA